MSDVNEMVLKESPQLASKLQIVFRKLSGILHLAPSKEKMSTEIIESVLPENFNTPIRRISQLLDFEEEDEEIKILSQKIIGQLHNAKGLIPFCSRLLLPSDVMLRISRDIIMMADNEPCGLRGCLLYLYLEGEHECRSLATIRCCSNTVSTFEVFLTLKQDLGSWYSLLPKFMKRLMSNTIVISKAYTLKKKKLYRSYSE